MLGLNLALSSNSIEVGLHLSFISIHVFNKSDMLSLELKALVEEAQLVNWSRTSTVTGLPTSADVTRNR